MKKDVLLSILYGNFLLILIALWKYLDNSWFVIAGILLISLLPVAYFIKPFSERVAMMVLYFSTLFLLLHYSLVGDVLNGNDIYNEYVYAKLVLENQRWDSTFTTSNLNHVLAIVFLQPILSLITGIPLYVVLKIVPNILYAFVCPLIFKMLQEVVKIRDISFYAVYYFLSYPGTYLVMPTVVRQQFAEITFIILVLVYIYIIKTKKLADIRIWLILPILCFNIVVSHYGFSIIYLFYGTLFLTFILVFSHIKKGHFSDNFTKLLGFTIILGWIFWIVWYLIRYMTRPGVAAINIIYKLIFYHTTEKSGISYLTHAEDFFKLGWLLPIIFTGLAYLVVLFGLLLFFRKLLKDKGIDPIKISYIFVAVAAILLPLLPTGSFGIIRSTHMVQYILLLFFGMGIFKLMKKRSLIIRTITVAFLVLLPLVFSNLISTVLLEIPLNPAISDKTRPDTWTTLDEYAGAAFIAAHLQESVVFTGADGGYPLGFGISSARWEKEITIVRNWKSDVDVVYIPKSALKHNFISLPYWTAGGLTYRLVEFKGSWIFREIIENRNLIYTSSGSWIAV